MPETIWTARAEADLQGIFSALEEFEEGRGLVYLEAVEASLKLLRLLPHMAPVYAGSHRRLVLRSGSHGIFYVVENRGIIIQAVCDLRQSRETILRHLSIDKDR